MKKLIVGGTFDETGGKPSYFVQQLADSLGQDWECVNGGNLEYIRTFSPVGCNVLLWMPHISNDESKILNDLKKLNPYMILIQSKRVIEKDYTAGDVIGRLLQSHSQLGIMIRKHEDVYWFDVLDPLGNVWITTDSINQVGTAVRDRVDYLLSMTRVGSIKKNLTPPQAYEPPDEFIKMIQSFGNEFAKFIKTVNPTRLLGNASTRCTKGFPAIRMDDYILVTRRNVDKETLSAADFVLVEDHLNKSVHYAGDAKPSVDTPIQVKLFEYYKNVQYMIHGHAYVSDGVFTHNKVPCGFLEEFDEVVALVPDSEQSNFTINLKGHGCLIMANDLDYLAEQKAKLYARPCPEA